MILFNPSVMTVMLMYASVCTTWFCYLKILRGRMFSDPCERAYGYSDAMGKSQLESSDFLIRRTFSGGDVVDLYSGFCRYLHPRNHCCRLWIEQFSVLDSAGKGAERCSVWWYRSLSNDRAKDNAFWFGQKTCYICNTIKLVAGVAR